MKNILIIQPIDNSGIEILENRPDYNFEIIDGTDLEQIKENMLYYNLVRKKPKASIFNTFVN